MVDRREALVQLYARQVLVSLGADAPRLRALADDCRGRAAAARTLGGAWRLVRARATLRAPTRGAAPLGRCPGRRGERSPRYGRWAPSLPTPHWEWCADADAEQDATARARLLAGTPSPTTRSAASSPSTWRRRRPRSWPTRCGASTSPITDPRRVGSGSRSGTVTGRFCAGRGAERPLVIGVSARACARRSNLPIIGRASTRRGPVCEAGHRPRGTAGEAAVRIRPSWPWRAARGWMKLRVAAR